ncbi:hypothetical protein GOODEAATRI_032984, partial [Goodea atripinnis]
YQQANVVVLPTSLADDFESFCYNNPAPLPLLYRSQSGETSCVPVAKNADIRTDIAQYCVYEEGRLVKTISSLQSYSSQSRLVIRSRLTHLLFTAVSCEQMVCFCRTGSEQHSPLADMVTFYLGCSFGFEGKLKEAGIPVRNVEQGKNVSMYRETQVLKHNKLDSLGPENIWLQLINVDLCAALLGIKELSKPDYGDPVEFQPGDVPVFWACGVTSVEAILSSKPALAFSHSPGCMFLTDIPDSPSPSNNMNPDLKLTPLCFQVTQNPLLYSLVSKAAAGKIRQLEQIIGDDPGKHPVEICTPDEMADRWNPHKTSQHFPP